MVAFVSGASRGIGAAIAKRLGEMGYDLALCARERGENLEKVAASIRKDSSVEVMCFLGDMGSYEFVQEMGKEILAHFGFVDVVVNNAGISHVGLLTDMSEDEWQRILSVNLSSAFYTTKVFAPEMIRKKSGNIINISSMWGQVGASCEVAYSATKGGLDAYTKALAKELAPSNIRVNAISCGVIDTDMNRCFSEEERLAIAEEIPMGRFGVPEEVAEVAAMVLQSTYVTGQVIRADGGMI